METNYNYIIYLVWVERNWQKTIVHLVCQKLIVILVSLEIVIMVKS